MKVSVLLAPKIYALDFSSLSGHAEENTSLSYCTLQWKRNKLWVHHIDSPKEQQLLALKSQEWLEACLRTSMAQAVCLDLRLNPQELKIWADACEAVGKPVFLRLPSTPQLPHKQHSIAWNIKRAIEWMIAFLLLLILSPLMLGLIVLLSIASSESIFFKEWCVGQRGRLFQLLKFRTTASNGRKQGSERAHTEQSAQRLEPHMTRLGQWICQFKLDGLPQLMNVVRGEISLVGTSPVRLEDAVRSHPNLQCWLNALPGIVGNWQKEAKALDPEKAGQLNFNYLNEWSLWKDLQLLLFASPKAPPDSNHYQSGGTKFKG